MVDKEINAQCAECGKVYQYVPKPGYPRKYCHECSAAKKTKYASRDDVGGAPIKETFTEAPNAGGGSGGVIPVVKPGVPVTNYILPADAIAKGIVDLDNKAAKVLKPNDYAKDPVGLVVELIVAHEDLMVQDAISMVRKIQEAFS